MSRFRVNPRLAQELKDSGMLGASTHAAARRIAKRVRTNQIMRRKGAAEISVKTLDPSTAAVVNTNHGAHLEEFGSVNNEPSAPLRTAARAEGLRLEEHGK